MNLVAQCAQLHTCKYMFLPTFMDVAANFKSCLSSGNNSNIIEIIHKKNPKCTNARTVKYSCEVS